MKWSDKEVDILQNNYKKTSKDNLLKMFPNRGASSVLNKIFQLGLCDNRPNWSRREDEIMKKFYGNPLVSIDEILNLLPQRSIQKIIGHASKLGIKRRIIYNLNHNFFDIPNLINSNIAGFTAADGCVSGVHRIRWVLHKRDLSYLEYIREAIEFDGPINPLSSRPHVDLSIHSQICENNLQSNFNITPRKTLTLRPPVGLSIDNALAYIIGYIDGDGSIFISDNYLHLVVYGNFDLLEWIEDILKYKYKFLNSSRSKVKHHKDSLHAYRLNGKYAVYIIDELKKMPVYKMKRKWNKTYDGKSNRN